MGILGLSRLIADVCPSAIKEYEIKSYFGRKVAIDASMSIYQFLIAIRRDNALMTNDAGETTSHLVGLFYRTCKMLEAGIKPIYVFDGKAPELKSGELEKRKERRAEADKKLKEAQDADNVEDISKFSRRLVRVTRQHNEDCKKLLQLMGLPVICSPSEAEAQCAQLCKEGLVYAIATEDMDGLTFGSPRLVRHLSSGNTDKVKEYSLSSVLSGLELTHEQFIDLCILMGCDYCESIKGIGGKKGLELIKKHRSIENILRERFNITEFAEVQIDYKTKPSDIDAKEILDQIVKDELEESKKNFEAKNDEVDENGLKEEEGDIKLEDEEDEKNGDDPFAGGEEEDEEPNEEQGDVKKTKKSKRKAASREIVPNNWLFKGARQLFIEPNVQKNTITEADLRLKDIDEEGLIKFLCHENGFSEERVRGGIKRIKECKSKCAQTRIDSFFKMVPSSSPAPNQKMTATKRTSNQKGPTAKRGRKPR